MSVKILETLTLDMLRWLSLKLVLLTFVRIIRCSTFVCSKGNKKYTHRILLDFLAYPTRVFHGLSFGIHVDSAYITQKPRVAIVSFELWSVIAVIALLMVVSARLEESRPINDALTILSVCIAYNNKEISFYHVANALPPVTTI